MPPPSAHNRRTIRYSKTSYGYARVCYELPVPAYGFRHLRALPMRRLAPRSTFWAGARRFFPTQGGLIHTFNDLVIGGRAWIVSHELELPRFLGAISTAELDRAYALLASPRCRRILPMSIAARDWFLRRVPVSLRAILSAKTQVFTGGVNAPEDYGIVQPSKQRRPDQPLRMAFVGNDAFRKGGIHALDAFDRLRAGGLHVELDFVGGGATDNYVAPFDADAHRRLLQRLQNTAGVRWLRTAPNTEVLRLLASAHVGLLPTLDDSLGWSVVEMMAARLPVVASNIVALPELIEDGVTGRLIDLPRDEDNRWIGVLARRGDAGVVRDADQRLVNGIVDAVAAYAANEDLRVRMGAAGRARYEQRYTPQRAGETLAKIYDEVYAEM